MGRIFSLVCRDLAPALMLCACPEATAQPWKAPGPAPTNYSNSSGSSPMWPHRFRDAWYFAALDGLNGMTLWRTDGTQEGTHFCLAFRNEAAQVVGGNVPTFPWLLAGPDRLFLWTDQVVWSTDGTAEGTQEVWRANSGKSPVLTSTGIAWLAPRPGTPGDRVWVSDGTPEGTRIVGGSSMTFLNTTQLMVLGEFFVIGGTTSGSSARLHLLDPEGGTVVPLSDTIAPQQHSYYVTQRAQVGESLVFFGADRCLYATRGTPESTMRLSNATAVDTLTPAGLVCYFIADGSPLGRNLWVTDGTPAGTRYITSNNPLWAGTANRTGGQLMAMDGDVLWFSGLARYAPNQSARTQVFSLAGPDQEPVQRTFYPPGTAPNYDYGVTAAGGRVLHYRGGTGSSSELSIYMLDGSPEGASRISPLLGFTTGYSPRWGAPVADGLMFTAETPDPMYGLVSGYEPHFIRGATGETYRLAQIRNTLSGGHGGRTLQWQGQAATVRSDGVLLRSGAANEARWVSFGIPAANVWAIPHVMNFRDGLLLWVHHRLPTPPNTYDLDIIYLASPDSAPVLCARLPWASDATPPSLFADIGSRVVFEMTEYSGLWSTDGTPEGTGPVAPQTSPPVTINAIAAGDGQAYLLGRTPADGCSTHAGLFISDGTPQGTRPLWLSTDDCHRTLEKLAVTPSAVYFTRYGSSLQQYNIETGEISTPANPDQYSSLTGEFRPFGDDVYVRTTYYSIPDRVYYPRLDVIREGTISAVTTRAPLSDDFTVLNGRVLFVHSEPGTGAELWTTDNSPARASLLRDIRPGTVGSWPAVLTTIGDHVFFTADDGPHGREVWMSDGTAEGTVMVGEIHPGPQSAGYPNLFAFARAGPRVFFWAVSPSHGSEVWYFFLPGECDADYDGSGTLDGSDVATLVEALAGGDTARGLDPDFNRDGNADQDDIAALVDTIAGGGCP